MGFIGRSGKALKFIEKWFLLSVLTGSFANLNG